MSEEAELEVLLSLDGYSYEAAEGYVVEFFVRRVRKTSVRPHGLSYAFVFRPKDGEPYVRFDNAHSVDRPGGRFVKDPVTYDHWPNRRRSGPPIPFHHGDAAS